MRLLFYSLIASLLLGSGCQKEDTPQIDNEAPIIQIIHPQADQVFTPGETIAVELNINENQELHEYSIVLRNADRSVAVTLESGHLHSFSYTYAAPLTLPTLAGNYTLTVKANDHNGNMSTEQVQWIAE